MKLINILNEKKLSAFEKFAENRLNGATKIVNNAKEKGGPSMLTYHHFNVKLPYYKKASEGNFNIKESKIEFKKYLNQLCDEGDEMEQVQFQKLVGIIEVIGELIIKFK
jgi:hypothetical protein